MTRCLTIVMLFAFTFLTCLTASRIAAQTPESRTLPVEELKPLLPPTVYVVAGTPLSIHYDNLVLAEGENSVVKFSGQCKIGHEEDRKWIFDGKDILPGVYSFDLSAKSSQGKVETSSAQIVVSSPVSTERPLRLLIVGDSLTNATYYPNRIAELLRVNGHTNWSMIGTRSRSNALEGVNHEGYGGKAWSWFSRHFEAEPDPEKNKLSSPFVFPQRDGDPKLDFAQYLRTNADGRKPDVITILLGINDCFTASGDPDKRFAEKIRWMFENADIVVSEFRKNCPEAKIGICITPPSNRRESAFIDQYQEKYPHRGWQIVLRQLQKSEIEHFQGRESENIYLVPIELNLDTMGGFPEDNAVHPNPSGYDQIGDSIYAWFSAVCR